MVLVKILKRRDASSVVVAIVVGTALMQFLQAVTNKWAIKLANVNYGSVPYHWKEDLLMPLVWFVLILVALEVLGWIWVWGAAAMRSK